MINNSIKSKTKNKKSIFIFYFLVKKVFLIFNMHFFTNAKCLYPYNLSPLETKFLKGKK